ncbi:uncharacterized protein LOC119321019 [Triticum dicoccoides]|uniref:uncharacterized protein LOC119321019 n=1 Tax=Triticum dicoccoides TaxID=85692 RepID=UPI001891EE71|nr:uncharacterized protein LOC119321019 [Triticum dicoccoides]
MTMAVSSSSWRSRHPREPSLQFAPAAVLLRCCHRTPAPASPTPLRPTLNPGPATAREHRLGIGGAMLRLGLHPCPHFSPPQFHPTLPRRLAASPLPRPPFPSAVTALRARNPPLQAAVSGAASGEELRGADEDEEGADLHEALTKTRRLVECAMFASVAGLAYFLSNSLAIENYFSCFFPLPIVISSLRWGLEAGRKTMVATVLLLFTLSGPVKALTYLLMHGVVGLSMGTMWRLETNWIVSIIICAIIRAVGACGYVLVTSFLIRENIFQLITVNIHASLTYILAAAGVNTIPSMDAIYVIFGTLVLLNSGFFVFILHIIYTIFLTKLGIKPSLRLPGWLGKATSS